MLIAKCSLTKSNSEILKAYSSNAVKGSRLHSGIDIKATKVYSVCPGVIVQRFNEDELICLTIQYDSNLVFRYRRILSSDLDVCDAIRKGDLVGQCDKFIHFECISRNDDVPIFPIEMFGNKYYKIDPLPYIDGSIQLYQGFGSEVSYI